MEDNPKKFTFEEIFKQNEKRIHYHIHKLHIQDPHREFYVEGIYAMWTAYKKHQPDQGPLGTYFNYTIRNRLIDMIRKRTRDQQHDEIYAEEQKTMLDDGNRFGTNQQPIIDKTEIIVEDSQFWQGIKDLLSEKQWKWVDYYIIQDLSVKEIAEIEGVSVDAVKSWGREARKKLRDEDLRRKL